MAKYQWEGVTRNGEARQGVMEAGDEMAVQNRLRADQITPRKIKKAAECQLSLSIGRYTPSEE